MGIFTNKLGLFFALLSLYNISASPSQELQENKKERRSKAQGKALDKELEKTLTEEGKIRTLASAFTLREEEIPTDLFLTMRSLVFDGGYKGTSFIKSQNKLSRIFNKKFSTNPKMSRILRQVFKGSASAKERETLSKYFARENPETLFKGEDPKDKDPMLPLLFGCYSNEEHFKIGYKKFTDHFINHGLLPLQQCLSDLWEQFSYDKKSIEEQAIKNLKKEKDRPYLNVFWLNDLYRVERMFVMHISNTINQIIEEKGIDEDSLRDIKAIIEKNFGDKKELSCQVKYTMNYCFSKNYSFAKYRTFMKMFNKMWKENKTKEFWFEKI